MIDAGLPMTSFRGNFYMNHLLKNEVENIKKGFFNSPIGKCKNSFVSACDQGEAAAVCLLEGAENHANKFYDITGPQPQSMHEVARDLSEAMGQKVEYREQDIDQFAKDFGPTRAQFFEYLRNGFYTRCSPDFYNITGRKAASYKEYLTQPGPHGGTGLDELFSATGSMYTKGVDQFAHLANVSKDGAAPSAAPAAAAPARALPRVGGSPSTPPWVLDIQNRRATKRKLQPLKEKSEEPEGPPSHATHKGLAPKQKDHYMYTSLMKRGANFFPFNPDYHWLPYYGGDAAPKWENPKDNPVVGWADHVTSEVDNALVNCAIDLPVFGILDVQGPKAEEFIGEACTKKASKKVGDIRLGYTLTKEGTMWNDVSLNTRGENNIYFIGLAGFGKYELDDLEGKMQELGYTDKDVKLINRSYDQQLFHVFGPKAPKILSEVLGKEIMDVPFFKFRKFEVNGIPFEAYRMSYAALPGWELHTTKEFAPQLYDMILDHPLSKAEGMKPCGVMGIQSLRTEMWFRGTPDVKGACHYKGGMIDGAIRKKGEFYGMAEEGYVAQEQVVMMTVEVPKGYEWSLFGAQYPVYYNGEKVGHTLHSAYGGRSKRVHAFCKIDAKIQAAGKMFSIQAHEKEMSAFQIVEPIVQSTFRNTA